MKRLVVAAAAAALAVLGFGILPAGALASSGATRSGCVVDSTSVVKADSGNHGDWAQDTFTRKVTICEADGSNVYTAQVEDSGSFTTIPDALSPNAGVAIAHVVSGSMKGGFSASFTAAPGFATYTGKHGDSTSTWVQGYFSDFVGSSINPDWSWSYWTDCEKWIDSAVNGDGALPIDGDITGKVCTKPTPTPTPVSTPTPAPTPPPAGGAGSGTGTAPEVPGLPDTGLMPSQR